MRVRDTPALGLQPIDRASNCAIGRAPAEDEQVATRRSIDVELGNVVGNAGDLRLGLLQGLENGGGRDLLESIGPAFGLDGERDLQRRTIGAQRALSSFAVAPS